MDVAEVDQRVGCWIVLATQPRLDRRWRLLQLSVQPNGANALVFAHAGKGTVNQVMSDAGE